MHLKFKEKLNNLITNKVDLGEIVYTSDRISDSNIEKSLYDVYGRPSIYKKNAWYDIENDCKNVHGYGLTVTGYNCNFFSTAFFVRLNGTLYKIVDTPSQRIAYTNDSRFDFKGVKVRVYGCKYVWTRDNIRAIVKPYLKAIGAKKGKVEYLGFGNDYKFILNGCDMSQKEIENFNQEYYKTYINLWKEWNKMTDEQMQDYIELIALSQERYDYEDAIELMDIITSIFGYNEQTIDDINYYLTGYNSYEQLKELEEEEKRGIL